jgi:hypothetical protein
MASGALRDYFGRGLASARPAAPDLYDDVLGFWFATDTGILSAWNGSAWEDVASVDPIVAAPPSGGWSNGAMLIYSATLGAFVEIPPGTPGQVMTFQTGDTADWEDPTGGGAVLSVNGQTGAVVLSLFDLSDVLPNTGAPEDGDVLTWDAAQGAWVASPAVGGVASVNGQTGVVLLGLEDLVDVLPGTGAPDDGDVLRYSAADDAWRGEPLQGDGLDVDSVGFRGIPSNSQSTAYTAVAADSGKSIDHPSTDANARTFTIPANGSVAYPIGTTLSFSNMTSQVVTIAITTDTMYLAGTGATGSRSLAQYGTATARKLTSTTWLISGIGLT